MMMSEGLSARPEFMLKDKRKTTNDDTAGAFLTTADELARRKKQQQSSTIQPAYMSPVGVSLLQVAGFTVKNDHYGLGFDPVRDKKLFSEVRELAGFDRSSSNSVSTNAAARKHVTIGQSLKGKTGRTAAFGLGALEEMDEDEIDDVYGQDDSLFSSYSSFLFLNLIVFT